VNVPISKLKANPKNPRVIRGDKFDKLKASLQAFPDMLNKRPLIVFTDKDGKYIVLGGNMRLKAAKELGLTELPVIVADNWTEEQKAEFLVKDNVNYGDWDHEQLANEWDEIQLTEWGLDLPVFEPLEAQGDTEQAETEQTHTITLEYTTNDYAAVKRALSKIASTPEQAVWKLLDL
jgi:ParB-like chromosome segregation protein Spo0J